MDVSRELSEIKWREWTDSGLHRWLMRDLFEQAWYRSNRAYGLRPVLEKYDYTVGIWEARGDRVHSAQRQWSDTHSLPPPVRWGYRCLLRRSRVRWGKSVEASFRVARNLSSLRENAFGPLYLPFYRN